MYSISIVILCNWISKRKHDENLRIDLLLLVVNAIFVIPWEVNDKIRWRAMHWPLHQHFRDKYSLYVYCLLEDLLYLFRTFTDHSANGKQHPNNITHSAFTSENEERTMSLINKSKPSEGNGKHMPTESALPPVRHFRTGCGEYLKISQTDFCKIAQVHA